MTKSSRYLSCTYIQIFKLLNKVHYKYKTHLLELWQWSQVKNCWNSFSNNQCFEQFFQKVLLSIHFRGQLSRCTHELAFWALTFWRVPYEFVGFILFFNHRFLNLFHRNLRNSYLKFIEILSVSMNEFDTTDFDEFLKVHDAYIQR